MKNIMLIIYPIFFIFVSCNAQVDKKIDNNKTRTEKNKPKIDYKVNKEYDENGNLTRFDSTYTYYYSNKNKNTIMNDSIFKKFYKHFNRNNSFDNSFFNNSFKEDFFRENLEKDQEMMQKMDSLKKIFFDEITFP